MKKLTIKILPILAAHFLLFASATAAYFVFLKSDSGNISSSSTSGNFSSTGNGHDFKIGGATLPKAPDLTKGIGRSPTETTRTPGRSTPSNSCSQIVARYEGKLAELDVQIKAQFEAMNNITNARNFLDSGNSMSDILREAESTRLFNEAKQKADFLTAEYASIKNKYQNELLGAGCYSELKKLVG